MVFRKRKERTDRLADARSVPGRGSNCRYDGIIRTTRRIWGAGGLGRTGGSTAPLPYDCTATVEEVSAGLPVALTVSDYTGHTCALWEARFPELRQMALEQCRWFKEEEVGKGERHIFLFDRLPAAQRIVYIALSVYPTRDSPGGCLSELFYSEKRVSSSF